jgi:hypothetical protein
VESEEQQKKQSWLLKTTGCVSVKDKKNLYFQTLAQFSLLAFFHKTGTNFKLDQVSNRVRDIYPQTKTIFN